MAGPERRNRKEGIQEERDDVSASKYSLCYHQLPEREDSKEPDHLILLHRDQMGQKISGGGRTIWWVGGGSTSAVPHACPAGTLQPGPGTRLHTSLRPSTQSVVRQRGAGPSSSFPVRDSVSPRVLPLTNRVHRDLASSRRGSCTKRDPVSITNSI